MITINSNSGLVSTKNWDEVISLPGYVDDLDPVVSELKEIIGNYVENEKVRCGLSCCHTFHNKGYIVITKDGHKTNIGNRCGKKYFGVNFEIQSKEFDRLYEESKNRESLMEFKNQIQDIKRQVSLLNEGRFGAIEINKRLQFFTSPIKGLPKGVFSRIENCVRNRSGKLTSARVADEKEISEMEAFHRRTFSVESEDDEIYVEETIGILYGIEALFTENSLRDLLTINLTKKIKDFEELDIDQLSFRDLKNWNVWKNSVPSTLQKASLSLRYGRTFLNYSNLSILLDLPLSIAQRSELKRILTHKVCFKESTEPVAV